ncbi:MAG: SCO family protein [Nonlabens sp.]
MAKSKDTPYYIGLGIIILIFGYFAVTNVIHYIEKDKVVDSNRTQDREPVADKFLKKFNKVPDFTFLNQDGDTITNDSLLGKVYVLDFFFTSCPTICPPMSVNMAKINEHFKDENDFMTVSISIDPEHDQPEVLKQYSQKFIDDDSSWYFLTGDREATYELSRKGFYSFVEISDDPSIGFEHSGKFVLVDREGYIRSREVLIGEGNKQFIFSYDGIKGGDLPDQVTEIIQDAETLLNK